MIKKINGYKIFMGQKLGKGAYGTVYKGEKTDTETPCAVKVLDKSSINSDPYLKSALISEIKVMKALKNPNIVELLEVMESSNNYYIIQELCDTDLEGYLKTMDKKILPEKESIRILKQICSGFMTMVKEGILHRDLKPANIFLAKGQAKIGDFGFAKKNQKGLRTQTAVGTPLYMPIEVLKGLPYTSKVDVWALGFIFYEMLHGRTPWNARSEFQLIENIQKIELKLDPHLSHYTKDFLSKCLQITEDKRMSWDEVFRHPIFENCFQPDLKGSQLLQNKYKKVMADIRFQVNLQNISLKKLWDSLGYDDKKQLNEKEFKKFMQLIVPNLDAAEQEYFYRKMDANGDGSISLKEMENEFEKNKIPLTSQFQERIPFLLKRLVSAEEEPEDMSKMNSSQIVDPNLEKRVRDGFKKLELILKKKNATLYKVFEVYDSDKSGELSLDEFKKVMKRLDSGLSEDDLHIIFDVIDVDGSKTITFDELNSYYSKINGIPESMNLPEGYHDFKRKSKA